MRASPPIEPGHCGLYGQSPAWNSIASPPSNADELVALAESVGLKLAPESQAYWFENGQGRVALCYHRTRSRNGCGASNVTFKRIDGRWHTDGLIGLVVC